MIEGRIIEATVIDDLNRIVATRFGWGHARMNHIAKSCFRVPAFVTLPAVERNAVLLAVLEADGLPKGRAQ